MGFEWSRTDATMGDGFLRIAREQIAKAIEGAGDESVSSARRIHESRRRCKKLRGLLRLVRPGFRRYREEKAAIRNAARHLAEARDAGVVRQTLATLMQWADTPITPLSAEPADEEKEHAVLARFAVEMGELARSAEDWTAGKIDERAVEDGLAATYRAARIAGQRARLKPSDVAFHEWRKLAKYHWHHLNLLEGCAGPIIGSEAKAAGDLGDQLGLHHDLAMLVAILADDPAQLGPHLDVPFITAAARRRQAELAAEVHGLGDQLFAETPKALRRRFGAYLEAWRAREAV